MEKAKSHSHMSLMEAFDLTPSELELNATGLLSERQRLHATRSLYKWLMSAIAAGVFAVIAYAAGGLNVFTIGLGAFFAYAVYRWWQITGTLSAPLESVEGLVTLDVKSQGQYGMMYEVALGDLTFMVKKDVFLAFKNGDPYRLFYAPRSKTLVAAEWLRPDDN